MNVLKNFIKLVLNVVQKPVVQNNSVCLHSTNMRSKHKALFQKKEKDVIIISTCLNDTCLLKQLNYYRGGILVSESIDIDKKLGSLKAEQLIVQHFHNRLKSPQEDLNEDPQVRESVIQSIMKLNQCQQTNLRIYDRRFKLTDGKLEIIAKPYIQNMIKSFQYFLNKYSLSTTDVDRIVLEGNFEKHRYLKNVLMRLFGKKKFTHRVGSDEIIINNRCMIKSMNSTKLKEKKKHGIVKIPCLWKPEDSSE